MKKTVFTGKNAYGLTAGKSGKRCRRKGLALGICAAILGTAGVAGASQAAWAYTESYMDADGKLVIKIYKNGDTDTVTDESDEVTAAEQGNAIESAAEDFTITTVQDGQNPEKKADTEAAENSVAGQIECWAELDSYLYKALGLEYNEEQKAWMWKGKPVYAIWFADTGLTIYGDVKAEGKNCLHITWESSDGTATFKVQEMTKEELKKAYGTSLAE